MLGCRLGRLQHKTSEPVLNIGITTGGGDSERGDTGKAVEVREEDPLGDEGKEDGDDEEIGEEEEDEEPTDSM